MLDQIETIYDEQKIFPDTPLDLKPVEPAKIKTVQAKLAWQEGKPSPITKSAPKDTEDADLPEILDHYLFW